MEQSQGHPGQRAVPSETVVSLMRYKQWADAELVSAARGLRWLGRVLVGRFVTTIIRHFHTVDSIFRAHLLARPHSFTSANPAEPATLAELEERMRDVDAWYVEYAQDLDERALGEPVNVTFTDGGRQVLTRSDILLHVSQHGAYHRGNVGILLKIGGAGPLPDRFTSYLRLAGPAARAGRGQGSV
jgi:uncharacterized damage-inducible protein DinB